MCEEWRAVTISASTDPREKFAYVEDLLDWSRFPTQNSLLDVDKAISRFPASAIDLALAEETASFPLLSPSLHFALTINSHLNTLNSILQYVQL